MDGRASAAGSKGLVLDPRTKLLMLITVSALMLSTSNEGLMNILKPVLTLIPFVLILSERKIGTAVKYMVLYAVCFAAERFAMSWEGGMVSFMLLAACSIMTRFAPAVMTGAFLVSSTSVSEFICAMERMHISEKIVIPMSVIFRFIPTIRDEYHAISDAMRMRGISFRGKKPLEMIEYRIVPLMISVVKIGDELSAASLTRGLGAPVKRTNICRIGFGFTDFIFIFLCILCFAAYFLQDYISIL